MLSNINKLAEGKAGVWTKSHPFFPDASSLLPWEDEEATYCTPPPPQMVIFKDKGVQRGGGEGQP